MNKWICKKDKVLVIAGNDKGKVGEVLKVNKDRIKVQGVNLRHKHQKSRQEGQPSQIAQIELPIDISNVCLCDGNGKKLKLKIKINKDGSKELVYFENDKEKTYRVIKKIKGK